MFGFLPEQASTIASKVDALYLFLIAVSLFFSLLIATLIVVFAVRFRQRTPDDRAAAIHGSLALELFWSIIPFCISMFIFAWGASLFVTLKRPPNDSLPVFVVGKQWMWKVQHLEGRREINALHVPVGRPVKLTLTSEDVIHSFFVPAFRIKQDAVPGRYTTVWFEATKPGRYHLFCAEYCGTQHSRMIGEVVVMEAADYQEWLGGADDGTTPAGALAGDAAPMSVADLGHALFGKLGCATCHAGQSGTLGPSLAGLYGDTVKLMGGARVTADETYLRESILNPRAKLVDGYEAVMPTFQGQVNEEQLLQLIEYIRSLKATRDS